MKQLDELISLKKSKPLIIETLGQFRVYINGKLLDNKSWGRDKTLQLFQFFITSRHRKGLHKEQIIDRMWEGSDGDAGDRDFKVALHGINKVLEPNRKSRSEPKYISRQGLSYQLNFDLIWIDCEVIEQMIAIGHEDFTNNKTVSIEAYSQAIKLYNGPYLPDRMYEDWCSEERERLNVLILGALINLAQLLLENNSMESIRLCQKALQMDKTWEDAYRVQMEAYIKNGNRPMALRTYTECENVLDEEFGISPLPITKSLLKRIEALGS